ncbi:hypothetical protein EH243_02190 [Amphritea opalescens]|uniref:XRE family transcriptional regulator n=1 Tax=Amphritea opalescens TaxID=2490544 RepID=A0A430KWA7_9GAMM|nr:hypothetical protein [Amphritea opalescens]RTE67779.1 hypothetical protein EH243_02190 [Amphritea opalescens]
MEWIPTAGLLRWISALAQQISDYLQPEQRLVKRVVRICKAHGIERTQICRIFHHHNFTPTSFSSVNDAKQLITAKFVDELADLFNIERNWLEGSEVILPKNNSAQK